MEVTRALTLDGKGEIFSWSTMNRSGIHHLAARGYEAAPTAYERGRPSYPAEAVTCLMNALAIGADSLVLELAAGTGKFTRSLASHTRMLIATEPVSAMRRTLHERTPPVPVIGGTAEHIPVVAASVDAVVVAQAFHWFDGPAVLDEIHRVLRPDGALGLIWNVRDEAVAWVHELSLIMEPHSGDAPRYSTGEWKNAFAKRADFSTLEEAHFRSVQTCDWETVRDRVASVSFIAALPESARSHVLQQTRQVLLRHPQTSGNTRYELPYRADVFWCRKRQRK
jgi:SAM-dependent methyltransferase